MAAASSSRRTFDVVANAGTNGWRKPGSGREPITVSTAILSGMGARSVSGVLPNWNSIRSPMRERNPLVSAKILRATDGLGGMVSGSLVAAGWVTPATVRARLRAQ